MTKRTATKKPHTCDPEDRWEKQLDADCLRCQEIMANRIKREPKKAPTLKSLTIPEKEEG